MYNLEHVFPRLERYSKIVQSHHEIQQNDIIEIVLNSELLMLTKLYVKLYGIFCITLT